MRLTPAQIAIRLICGGEGLPPRARDESLSQRIRTGHRMLRRITGKDFGYELARWHSHLKVSREGGYTWGRNIELPKVMQAALASSEWREAVRTIEERAQRRSREAAERNRKRGIDGEIG